MRALATAVAALAGLAACATVGGGLAPVAWTPDPVAPAFAVAPRALHIIRTLPLDGPEDCARRADGVLACGAADGRIALVAADLTHTLGVLASTGGRPLGMEFDDAGRLLIADSRKGLLAVSPSGEVATLRALEPAGDLVFPDDVAPHAGRLWLSDASSRNGYDRVAEEFTERRATGALYALDSQGRGRAVLHGLAFANGIALSPSGAFLLVNETSRSRVRRLWLTGPKAGTNDIWVSGLPGNPDNLAFDARGRVWIALVTPRDVAGEALAGQPRERLRRFRPPTPGASAALRPSVLLQLDGEGRLIGQYAVPYPDLGNVTSVTPTPAGLVLGSNKGSHLALAAWPAP